MRASTGRGVLRWLGESMGWFFALMASLAAVKVNALILDFFEVGNVTPPDSSNPGLS